MTPEEKLLINSELQSINTKMQSNRNKALGLSKDLEELEMEYLNLFKESQELQKKM